ncbi:MAG: selenide, water dikinase SelD, partial [Bacteroidales bacterium]|nr:selenide, water dikinase SelD [Bacteroidales bacterium]
SSHIYGIQSRKAIEEARKKIADLINCFPDEIIFTSGGTESNNYAIKGAAFQNRHKGNHIITTSVEHPAVTEVCRYLEEEGFRITFADVDEYGRVDPLEIEKYINPSTILISVMHANNEVGTIQPIEEIGRIANKHKILFHCDAAQTAGKIKIDVKETGVDLLSLAGHKFYAPKGIGVLFIRRGVKLRKLIHGADHEQNLRAGTENILEIAGMGKAAEIAIRDLEKNQRQMQLTRDLLFELIQKEIPEIHLNGHPELHLPNTLNISFPGLEANLLLDELHQVAASAGAACHSDRIDISPVLLAMKVPQHLAMGTIRFSTGKHTTEDEIREAAKLIIAAAKKLMPGVTKEILPEKEDSDTIKLTRYTQGLGCACKIRPQYLEQVLKDLPAVFDKNILVGLNTSDDAAVYRISDEVALVQTVDFFTPIVDDPYTFGAIAAANALSDIYAMGARPIFALNIVGFPSNRLPMQVLKDILRGASDKAAEAGITIAGGHSVDDPEPKFGMVVSGVVNPDKIITNAGARPGDVLILTKPIGTGIISTAVKKGMADEPTLKAAQDVMLSLNREAAEIMESFPVQACTDITGFGLMGHLKEMMEASGTSCVVESENVPLIRGVYELALSGAIPGGTQNNLLFVAEHISWNENFAELMKLILCDAQTSGGLLISVASQYSDLMLQKLKTHQPLTSKIGYVEEKSRHLIHVI